MRYQREDIQAAAGGDRDAFERRVRRATVRAALVTPSAAHREAVVMYHLGVLSQHEAADFLGIPASAVAVR